MFEYTLLPSGRRREPVVIIDLHHHTRWMRAQHRSVEDLIKEIIRSIDHGVGHSFSPFDKNSPQEERLMKEFERAGVRIRA